MAAGDYGKTLSEDLKDLKNSLRITSESKLMSAALTESFPPITKESSITRSE